MMPARGMIFTQAARSRSTSALPILRASSSEAAVVRTSILSVIYNHLRQFELPLEWPTYGPQRNTSWHGRRGNMATQIKFGTSGWRAVMADEFTFANVRRAVTGIARYVGSRKASGGRVIVGRDPRFLGETFCFMADE